MNLKATFINCPCMHCDIEIKLIVSLLQDYHWWWKSFFLSGGCAFYVLLYSIFYFHSKVSHQSTFLLNSTDLISILSV